jgi:hypothetical protein
MTRPTSSSRVAAEVVAEALSGTCPAWALPYDDFTAIADAAEAMWPSPVFETATACDFLLSCVLNGDQVMATHVLADPSHPRPRAALARALLSLAIAGEGQDTLLPQDVLTLLRRDDVPAGIAVLTMFIRGVAWKPSEV